MRGHVLSLLDSGLRRLRGKWWFGFRVKHLEDSHREPELERKDRRLPGSSGGGPCVSPGDLRVTGGQGRPGVPWAVGALRPGSLGH